MPDSQTECSKWCFRTYWLLSGTVWVILQIPTMERMGKMQMLNRRSRARGAKMTNPVGWWAHSAEQFSSAWRGFGWTRWSWMNWLNQDGRTQLATSVETIWSMANWNWTFSRLLIHGQNMIQWDLHRWRLESLWSVLTLYLENRTCRKGHLNQDVFILG